MAMGWISDSTLSGIASAIREKTGTDGSLYPSQMAQAIHSIACAPARVSGTAAVVTVPAQNGSSINRFVISVTCGFRPDLVMVRLPGLVDMDTGRAQDYLAGFPFKEWEALSDHGEAFTVTAINNALNAACPYVRMSGQATDTGFSISLVQFRENMVDYSGNFGFQALEYAAVKYE